MATSSSFWLKTSTAQRTTPVSSLFERLGSDGELDPHRIAGIERGQEAQILEAGIGQHRARIGIDEQAGGEAQDQIAVGDPAFEDRVRLGRFLVHVGVEFVAGELGEMLDVLDA